MDNDNHIKKRIPVGANYNFAIKHPSIAKEWHFKLNYPLLPTEVAPHSHKKIWWQCQTDEDHIWQARIQDRHQKNTSCPYCSNHKINNNNSLAVLHPELLKEWDFNKNTINPYQIPRGYDKKVWWVCIGDNSHSWSATPNNRTNAKTGCPICRATPSKGNLKIKELLKKMKVIFVEEKIFKDCRAIGPLKFDFYLPEHSMCIGYDGLHHFEEMDPKLNRAPLEIIQKYDSIKNKYCENNCIYLLRIPYWEYKSIEDKLYLNIMSK